MADNCTEIYTRLLRAYKRGTGFKLSAEEVQILVTMDDAISTVLTNIECGDDLEDGSSLQKALSA